MPTDGLVDAGASHRPAKKARHATVTMDDVRDHLMSWRASALVDLILQQADEDDRLRDALKMRVAAGLAGGPDMGTFRTALRDAFRVDFDEPWQGTGGWAHGAGRVIDSIEELLGQGHARPVVDLCEEALELLDSAWGMIGDSDGDFASLAERIGDLHLEACQTAGIDQAELGRRLVDLELGAQQHEAFYGAIDRYELVLGEAGLAAYREAIERRWARVPPLGPGESDPERYGDRFRLTHMMERVTGLSGDVDQLVAVMARDLSAGHDFLRIAEVLREAGRHEEALEWAERGLAAFADRPDPRLREFAADEHHRVGRHDAAMELIWAAFEERPGLDTYQRLGEHARVAGADWSAWSDRALALLRADTERRSARGRRQLAWAMPADRSSLVEIFLWQNDVEAAWREAREGGCTRDLWLQLAQLRERDHPADAVPIYEERVQALLDQKNNRSYEEAVATMRRLRGAMSRLEPPGNFAAYVTALRAEHARKRNFMALLDGARW
jgi:tetratricopeptide (TPR) repeat protein